MTLAEEIHDTFLDATCDKPFDVDCINDILQKRIYDVLCKADGALSAIRHGRVLKDSELESIYYPIREICDGIRTKSSY